MGLGPHIKKGAAECVIKTVVNMERTMLMHAALRCTADTLSNDIWPMAMYYDVEVYNQIPYIQSGLPAIEMWSR